jgi:3-methyladenine DNA glycosylase/8-oxoguanine DNA glycosylase
VLHDASIGVWALQGTVLLVKLATFLRLFGAAQAYQVIVVKHGRDTPRKLQHCTSRELVAMLGEAHYVRYDESTAQRLLDLSSKLNAEYAGRISHIHDASADRGEFEKRLNAFEGVGPKTVEIFMRDAASVLF